MGDGFKKAGNIASSALTGGLISTSGKGLLQGGGIGAVLDPTGLVREGASMINKGNKIDVPNATAKPDWTLSSPEGILRSDLQVGNWRPEAANQTNQTLSTLQSYAGTQGPTKQAQYQMDSNNKNLANNLDALTAQGQGQLASANTNMAMRGGLDAGSRERMQTSNMIGNMSNAQGARNEASKRESEILANDEASKLSVMQSLPSQLLASAEFDSGLKQYDIDNTLNTVGGKYKEDMAAWAGNQQAREQAKLANKNQGLLGLGVLGL